MTSIILGIDPGISGALAFYWPADSSVTAEDMPVADGEVAGAVLASRLRDIAPALAVIELVHSMPGDGKRRPSASSQFNFGKSFGTVIGVVAGLGIPVSFVTPRKWKAHYGLPADKEAARGRALQLWPDRAELFARKKDQGRAEAALIAKYGSRSHNGD